MNKLLVIVGPTASGKSDLAMELAKKFGGEIICADSRTIYRAMDIGTAKPSKSDQAKIRHHLLDLVEPSETFSAAEFQRLAGAAIADIQSRAKLPIMAGGSGLYIDSVIFDYRFPSGADLAQRSELENLTEKEVLQKLQQLDPEAWQSVDRQNRRRLIRAIETIGQSKSKSAVLRPQTLVLGISPSKNELQRRIGARVKKQLKNGFFDEVGKIAERFGWDCPGINATGYRTIAEVLKQHKQIAERVMIEAETDILKANLALAKKQITWFKRNPYIRWISDSRLADSLVKNFLHSEARIKN